MALAGDVFRLQPSTNTGVAFGLLSGSGPLVSVLGAAGLILLAFYGGRIDGTAARALVFLLVAGGLSNLVERATQGLVLDYFDLGLGPSRWPTFNVADVAISLAIIGLGVAAALQGVEPRGLSRKERDRA